MLLTSPIKRKKHSWKTFLDIQVSLLPAIWYTPFAARKRVGISARPCLVRVLKIKNLERYIFRYLKVVWFGCLGHQLWHNIRPIAVKISSHSVQPLLRYYIIQTGSKVGTENLNKVIPLNWWHSEVTLISHIMKKLDFSNFFRRVHTSLRLTQTQSVSP